MAIYHLKEGARPRLLTHLEALPETGFVWLDCVRAEDSDWSELLQRLTGVVVHERHLKDSLNPAHPSYCDGTSEYEMVIFRSLSPQSEEGQFASRPTTFFMLPRLLVTVRSDDSRSVAQVKARLLGGGGRLPQRPAGLMHLILNAMVDRFLAMRESLTLQLEQWRGDLLDPKNPFDDWRTLMDHRRQLRKLEMLCEEQEDAVSGWREMTAVEIDDHLAVRLNDLLEHIHRVMRFAREQQAEIESLVQLHFSAVAHRTNEIVRVLTVLSAIFLPLTFIAGIFGMNFEHMPELKMEYAYFVALGAMTVLAMGLLLLFRHKRWL